MDRAALLPTRGLPDKPTRPSWTRFSPAWRPAPAMAAAAGGGGRPEGEAILHVVGRKIGADGRQNWAFYAQDSWKIRRNLTIQYGTRWEYQGPYDARNGLVLPNGATDVLLTLQGGSNGHPVTNRDLNNFAPFLGIAWAPGENGKTLVDAVIPELLDRVVAYVAGLNRHVLDQLALDAEAPFENVGRPQVGIECDHS